MWTLILSQVSSYMPFSKRKLLTKPKPSVQNLSVACFPRNMINALLDSRVWISKQYPDIDLPHQELLVKDVELYKLPGSKDSASFRDIIALNPEIQYILNTFGSCFPAWKNFINWSNF